MTKEKKEKIKLKLDKFCENFHKNWKKILLCLLGVALIIIVVTNNVKSRANAFSPPDTEEKIDLKKAFQPLPDNFGFTFDQQNTIYIGDAYHTSKPGDNDIFDFYNKGSLNIFVNNNENIEFRNSNYNFYINGFDSYHRGLLEVRIKFGASYIESLTIGLPEMSSQTLTGLIIFNFMYMDSGIDKNEIYFYYNYQSSSSDDILYLYDFTNSVFKYRKIVALSIYVDEFNGSRLAQSWSPGYNEGYLSGKNDGYINGIDTGKQQGFSEGYNKGYEEGKQSSQADYGFGNLFFSIANAPVQLIKSFIPDSINIFGYNLQDLLFSFFGLFLIIFAIKLLFGGGK